MVVELSQYNIDFDENSNNTDAYSQMSGVTRLSADLSGSEGPYIFILQDPEGFTAYTGALQYLNYDHRIQAMIRGTGSGHTR